MKNHSIDRIQNQSSISLHLHHYQQHCKWWITISFDSNFDVPFVSSTLFRLKFIFNRVLINYLSACNLIKSLLSKSALGNVHKWCGHRLTVNEQNGLGTNAWNSDMNNYCSVLLWIIYSKQMNNELYLQSLIYPIHCLVSLQYQKKKKIIDREIMRRTRDEKGREHTRHHTSLINYILTIIQIQYLSNMKL